MVSTQKVEEILEAIWRADEAETFTLSAVRQHCDEEITNGEIDFLASEGLIICEGNRVLFSKDGKARAQQIVRRHRLTESLLTWVLQLPQEQAHDIACDMEHILPPEMEASICTLLGHPEFSPTGQPIPPGDDCIRKTRTVDVAIVNLCELKPGDSGRIAYIRPKHHARLHRLSSFGIVPGVIVTVHQTYPAFCLKFEETECAIDEDIAEDIYVRRTSSAT